MLAAREPVGFVDPDDARARRSCVGAHGSLTADEMHVPLLAARGRAADASGTARHVPGGRGSPLDRRDRLSAESDTAVWIRPQGRPQASTGL